MFSVEWIGEALGQSSGSIGKICLTRPDAGKQYLCYLNTWAFSSCAAFSLQNFGNSALSKEEVDGLFIFLNSEECNTCWSPEEVYFMLSAYQLGTHQGQNLSKHLNVKKVDSFSNKAHGPNSVYLFRYSLAKDFPLNEGTT